MTDLPNFVPGYGNPNAKLMVIGMAPGSEENEALKPLIGRSGSLFNEMLLTAKMKRDEVYCTNVEKYRPPGDKLNKFKDIGRKPLQDIDLLKKEVSEIRPNCILLLGEHTLKAVTGKKGIKNWRGSILTAEALGFPDIKCVATYHPSALLRAESQETKSFSPSARAWIQNDYNRAVAQSKFAELRLPKRTLEYATTVDDIKRFRKLYKGLKLCSIDIETAKGACIPTCIGFAYNRHHGMSVPLLNVGYGFSVQDHEQALMIKEVQEILNDPELQTIGANYKFDKKKLYKPFAFKMPAPTYFDIGMAGHVLYPEMPKGVDFLTSVWTEEPFYKNELKEFDPEKEDFTNILLYNSKDVCVPYEIQEKMKEELIERGLYDFFMNDVMPLSDFYLALEERGMNYDEEIRTETREFYTIRMNELQESLNTNAGREINVSKYREIRKLLFEDLGIPYRKNTRDDTLVEVLAAHCKDDNLKYAIISDILELRKVRRTVNGPLKLPTDYDGRMRSIYNVNGTPMGRTSANILKPPERPTKVGFQSQNLTKHGEIGPEMRKPLRPDKGKLFYQIDMSQAEARVVAAIARDEWLLSLFERKLDVHSVTASWYFDKENPDDPENPLNISSDERFIGKTTRHAIGYGSMWKKMQLTINKLARKFNIPVTVSASECKMFRTIFMQKSPKIESIFWAEVFEQIKKKRKLIAASGRERIFFGPWDPNSYLPYIPSASVSDHNKFSLVKLQKAIPQIEILKEDHDSGLFQAFPKDAEEWIPLAREIYERPIDLSRCSLPRDPIIIPCDVEVGENYLEMKKWKK